MNMLNNLKVNYLELLYFFLKMSHERQMQGFLIAEIQPDQGFKD